MAYKKIFVLAKENILLAKKEVLAQGIPKEYGFIDNLLFFESTRKGLEKRLAYTKKILKLLFYCAKDDLNQIILDYDWDKVYDKNFSVRNYGKCSLSEKEIAGLIWNKIKNPKVNLIDSKTRIEFYFTLKKVLCGIVEHELIYDYDERKAHNRPELHPTSIHPRLARALINLTGIKNGKIIDPCCGSGGILLEAGLIGLTSVGYDIDKVMLKMAKINLDYYGIKNYKLFCKDSTKLNRKIPYLVTDLPYMKNTKKSGMDNFYEDFIQTLSIIIGKRAVIVAPDFMNPEKLFKKNKIKILAKFDYYVHKSLTRKIYLLEK